MLCLITRCSVAPKKNHEDLKEVFLQDPIPTSLLKINSDLVSRAIKLFQIILKYMGVESSDRVTLSNLDERIELVGKLYKHTLKRAELRDELFIQISKQTRNNPDKYASNVSFVLFMLFGPLVYNFGPEAKCHSPYIPFN